MPPKKDKAKKMALADFFADTTSGSWADDMVDVPTAPAARDPNLGPARGEAGYLDSMPDRGARSDRPSFPGAPLRDEVPVPTVPPFTAHVGNLTYEADEEALRQFFGPAEPSSVRIAKDIQSGQSKGYAHVDFPSADKLREALKMNGEQMQGRGIRISVAEPPANRKDYLPSAAEESSQWRRAGPLPAREAPAPRRGSSFAEPGPDRDWGAARGAKFVPAPPATGLGIRRESSGAGRMRDLPPSVADDAGQWRSARPLVEARGPANGGASGNSTPSIQGTPNLADTESTWSRGAKFRASQEPAPRHPVDSPNDDRDWRAARVPSVSTPNSDTAEDAPKAPAERRKLALAPRSSQSAAATSSENAEPKSPQANIFGAAKPIDTAAREAEVDKRMKEKEVERRKAAQAAKEEALRKEKEEDDKARQFAEERARAIQAVLNPGAAPAVPSGAPTGPKGQPGANRTPSGGIRGGRGSQRGGVRAQPPRNGPRSPNPNRPTNGEDGFAVAQGSGVARPARNAQVPVEKKKDQPRQFSFAAAAALVDSDLVDDDDGEEEQEEADESAETLTADVAEVQKGVEEIKV